MDEQEFLRKCNLELKLAKSSWIGYIKFLHKNENRDSDYENHIVLSKAVQELDFNQLDSLIDSIYGGILNRKCAIGSDALDRLKLYYQSQNITDLSCYNELVQFDKDLNDGNYYAQVEGSNRLEFLLE